MREENYYKDTPNPEPSLLAQIKSLAETALATRDFNEKIRCLNQIIRLSGQLPNAEAVGLAET